MTNTNRDEQMKNVLTLPPIVTRGTTGNSGGFTVDTGFRWGTYATADWQGAGEAIITNEGQTYSLPLSGGPTISTADMDLLHALLANTIRSTKEAGTYYLSDPKIPYATINDSKVTGAYLGRITLKMEGNFTRDNQGAWVFDGFVKAYADTYDFDASNRSTALETLTTAGRVFSGTHYEIDIFGEQKIRLNGVGYNPSP